MADMPEKEMVTLWYCDKCGETLHPSQVCFQDSRKDKEPYQITCKCGGVLKKSKFILLTPTLERAGEMRKLLSKNNCSSFPDSCHACGDIDCLTRDTQELLAEIAKAEEE